MGQTLLDIYGIAVGYDGNGNNVKGLHRLIDELKETAYKAAKECDAKDVPPEVLEWARDQLDF